MTAFGAPIPKNAAPTSASAQLLLTSVGARTTRADRTNRNCRCYGHAAANSITIDFVCFDRDNRRERLDQARTKANQRKVFIPTGDQLISKLNNTMMTIVEDTFKEGHHDLREGTCRRKRHELAAAKSIWKKTYGRPAAGGDTGATLALFEAE